jgi:hypothetical protein
MVKKIESEKTDRKSRALFTGVLKTVIENQMSENSEDYDAAIGDEIPVE